MAALGNKIFESIPKDDPLDFGIYNKTLDYKKVVKFLSFDTDELSKIGGVSKKSVRTDDNAPAELKARLKDIAIICSLVAEYFGGDGIKTATWFHTPNPMLGNLTPRDMIRLRRSDKLIKFIMEAREYNGEKAPK